MQPKRASTTWRATLTHLLVALSILTFASSCGRTNQAERIKAAAVKIGETKAEEAPKPSLPAYCRKTESAGVTDERLDEAVLIYDAALTTVNGRLVSCARWHDRVHGPRAGNQK